MLQEPMMEKLTAMRLLGMVDALKAQEQDPAVARTELPGTARPAGGSAVELARESGAGAAAAGRQAEGRLRRRDRLSRCARTGQERDPRAGAEVGLGRAITKTSSCSDRPAWARASSPARWRRRRAATDTRRSTRAPRAVPRSGHGTRRRQSAQSAGAARAASMCW